MIVTYNWLKEFVDFDYTPQELCDRLTMAGLEVDALTQIGGQLDMVIVARLEAVEKHPDADKLTVCQVNTGSEVVQVVCGATNHKSGDLVALAQPGAVLPGDFKIKKSKIRGQVSMGMLCSEKELGLSEEAAGILILPPACALGQPLFEALGVKDFQIEIGLTPNRPDCLSVVGVAREVAALCGARLKLPQPQMSEIDQPLSERAAVEIEDSDGCPRYAARMIEGLKIGPSPEWMVRRLEAVGMRSINNIVDITNYVMMELGHPLHAFDFRFLEEGRIVVKTAAEGDLFTTLDGQSHTLSAEDLMICDGRRPVAMAGVMGGLNSEVQDDTTTVLLEAAYFKPTSIRRTSKRHGLHTESSHRFERGADIDMIPVALNRAAALMAELGGGQILAGTIDNYPRRLQTPVLELKRDHVAALLDLDLEDDTLRSLLESIGLSVDPGPSVDSLEVRVPSFRLDIEREVDLIEEVARLYGYDGIPLTMPEGTIAATLPPKRRRVQYHLRRLMVASGFSEAMNYSFIAAEALKKINLTEMDERFIQVPLMNPLSEDQAVMRTSLVPSLLETVARNLNYRSYDLRLFELRPVFLSNGNHAACQERLSLTAVMSGRREPEGWAQNNQAVDFYDGKGVVEEILSGLGLSTAVFDASRSQPYFHPGKSCAIVAGDQVLGFLGEIHPQVLKNFAIDQPVQLFELDVEQLLCLTGSRIQFKPLSRFPDVIRDSALLLDAGIAAAQVLDIVAQVQIKAMDEVTLFDHYVGPGIPSGKKSLAIRVRYRDLNKTLTEEEVNKYHDKVIRALSHQLGAEIR